MKEHLLKYFSSLDEETLRFLFTVHNLSTIGGISMPTVSETRTPKQPKAARKAKRSRRVKTEASVQPTDAKNTTIPKTMPKKIMGTITHTGIRACDLTQKLYKKKWIKSLSPKYKAHVNVECRRLTRAGKIGQTNGLYHSLAS